MLRTQAEPPPDDHTHPDVPRYEPWLGVSAAAFIPAVALFFLPQSFMLPMIVLAGILLTTAIVMLLRQERRARHAGASSSSP